MLILNKKEKNVTSKRKASYAILTNDDGKIAVVRHKGWGLILPGGKKEKDETGIETIQRETLEEVGYEVNELKYYETIETFYDITVQGSELYCHSIAEFYIGKMLNKVQEPIETDTILEWYYPNEIIGKMKLEFQNTILEIIYNNNK